MFCKYINLLSCHFNNIDISFSSCRIDMMSMQLYTIYFLYKFCIQFFIFSQQLLFDKPIDCRAGILVCISRIRVRCFLFMKEQF